MEEIELKKGYKLITFEDELKKTVRTIFTGSSYQSVTYTDAQKYELYDRYTNFYRVCDTHKENINNCLVLGGGGFSYPKYYISKYPSRYMDVVELDDYMIEIAREYFFLDDLFQEHDPNKERLKIYNEDAFEYIKKCTKEYDSILIDLFNDNVPLYDMFTVDNLKLINNLMKNDALLAINYIITDRDFNYELFNEHINNLKSVFKNIKAIALPSFKIKNRGNIFLLASNCEINVKVETQVIEII